MSQRMILFLFIPSLVLLFLAIGAFTIFAASKVALVLVAVSLLAFLTALLIYGVSARITIWNKVAGVLVSLVCAVLTFGYLGWFGYHNRPKPDTVGYAEFNPRDSQGRASVLIRYDLPEAWRFRYGNRHAPYFSDGTVRDGSGRVRLSVYAVFIASWVEAPQLGEFARRTTEGLKKAGLKAEQAEYRETPRGQCWVYRLTRSGDGSYPFGEQSVLNVEYAEQWRNEVIRFSFAMPAEEAEELEPLTWQIVRTAQVRSADQHD